MSFTAAGRMIAECPIHRNRVYGVLAKAWADRKDFQVNEVEENLYAISFHSVSDLMYVLENAPWSVGGFLFNVKRWAPGMSLAEIDFSLESYWIQVHGLDVDELTYNSAVTIGSSLEILIKAENPIVNNVLFRGFLRHRVQIEVFKPPLLDSSPILRIMRISGLNESMRSSQTSAITVVS
ncbi:hypothetical protein SLEP1_g47011 [Rubroshorea leprosula]|uniref:DUF4283 domain-containing protein n=1 Tax=Rubroshorea leprosula TaxID=152421 RepID=A0AAV5LQS0_9ROSI|nr:hypothetical protein SLEP1_g47011 [Rubroshorea leprosula]